MRFFLVLVKGLTLLPKEQGEATGYFGEFFSAPAEPGAEAFQ
jgi:hypothetical protein